MLRYSLKFVRLHQLLIIMISASARLDAVGNASNFDEMRKR